MPKEKMPKSWLRFHERNILSESVANWSKLTPGNIVRFNYTGEYATVKRPLVLVLNSNWKGKMHAVSLDYISDAVLKKLRDIVQVTIQQRTKELIRLRLPLLKADIKDPRRFYESRLKPFIKVNFPKGVSPYRTYIRGNIRSLRLIDYRFKDFYVGSPENMPEEK